VSAASLHEALEILRLLRERQAQPSCRPPFLSAGCPAFIDHPKASAAQYPIDSQFHPIGMADAIAHKDIPDHESARFVAGFEARRGAKVNQFGVFGFSAADAFHLVGRTMPEFQF
jgi:hypothetical protein